MPNHDDVYQDEEGKFWAFDPPYDDDPIPPQEDE